MSNVNPAYANTRRSKKCCFWYHDRLPKYLREILKNTDHNWSDEQVYNAWKGIRGAAKLAPVDLVEAIERNERRIAYNWAPELKEVMDDAL